MGMEESQTGLAFSIMGAAVVVASPIIGSYAQKNRTQVLESIRSLCDGSRFVHDWSKHIHEPTTERYLDHVHRAVPVWFRPGKCLRANRTRNHGFQRRSRERRSIQKIPVGRLRREDFGGESEHGV